METCCCNSCKQLIKNYRPISLLPICGKSIEKIIFNNLYKHLTTHHLISKKQSGFRPGDSTTNQLIYLVNDIHHAFDSTKSHEVRAIFLDISMAFDKVWHVFCKKQHLKYVAHVMRGNNNSLQKQFLFCSTLNNRWRKMASGLDINEQQLRRTMLVKKDFNLLLKTV